MGMILVYEMKKEREQTLRALAGGLGHRVKVIAPSKYGDAIGAQAGISGIKAAPSRRDVSPLGGELLVFSGFDERALHELLSAMKQQSLQVELKAILTVHNLRWNARELYRELAREHESMKKRS